MLLSAMAGENASPRAMKIAISFLMFSLFLLLVNQLVGSVPPTFSCEPSVTGRLIPVTSGREADYFTSVIFVGAYVFWTD